MSSYANKFIRSRGEDAIIKRNPEVNTKVSIKRSTRAARDLGIREAYWEGLIPRLSNVLSGEYILVRDNTYLVQSANNDPASLERAFFATKCNCIIHHKQQEETVDEDYNVVVNWKDKNTNVSSYCEIITYRLRQEDPGLLESTKYTFQVPKSLEVKLLDRFVYNGENYQVDSIDDTGMSGVVRCQVSIDVRED